MVRRPSCKPPRSHRYRGIGAIVLLAAQLLMAAAAPLAAGLTAADRGNVEAIVCSCIHDPGTPCPMHGGGSRSRPAPGSGPHLSGCDAMDGAALIALVTTIGIPAAAPLVTPPVWSLGRMRTSADAGLDSPALPGVPPPRT